MKISEATILIVEDDSSIRFGLEEVLKAEGFKTISHSDGNGVVESIGEHLPDLVLLDVMLPGASGYAIAKELRETGSRIPVLMLTAKGQEMDKVIGLNAGADDYVTKPFGIIELLARIQALLRRSQDWGSGSKTESNTIQIGKATVEIDQYALTVDGERYTLTPKELELIRFLDAHRDVVLSRDRILDEIWGVRYFGTTRTLDQCIAQIRKKIGDDGRTPEYLLTVHGVGYKLL